MQTNGFALFALQYFHPGANGSLREASPWVVPVRWARAQHFHVFSSHRGFLKRYGLADPSSPLMPVGLSTGQALCSNRTLPITPLNKLPGTLLGGPSSPAFFSPVVSLQTPSLQQPIRCKYSVQRETKGYSKVNRMYSHLDPQGTAVHQVRT